MPSWVETVLQYLGGGAGVLMLGWYGRRKIRQLDDQHERIQAMAEAMKGKADREHLDEMSERLSAKLDEHSRESRASMQRLEGKLDKAIAEQSKINLEVARNLGRD